jgi:hypothetical protein
MHVAELARVDAHDVERHQQDAERERNQNQVHD